jgi:hypothetical protein
VSKYSKYVIAKWSPENGCHVPDGEVLSVVPRKSVQRNKDIAHHFVGTNHPAEKAKFGWVHDVAPFDIDEFARDHLRGRALTALEREHLETMFSSISGLIPGTPVTATYFVRGVIEKQTVFTVHRVIFHAVSR